MSRRPLLDPPPYRRQPAPERESGITLFDCMAAAGAGFNAQEGQVRDDVKGLLQRTLVTYQGTSAGFAIKPQWAEDIFDKARSVDGPLARCMLDWCESKELFIPSFYESSRAAGSRWGGIQAAVGAGEVTSLSTQASFAQMALINFKMERLIVYTSPISRDLLADSNIAKRLLSYAALSELRFAIEYSMIQGPPSMPSGGQSSGGPSGVLNAGGGVGAGVVLVAKDSGQTSGTITTTNIDNLWGAVYGPCRRNACWFANDDVMAALDEVASTGGWPQNVYLPQGFYGNTTPLIKGRPLLPCEACNAIGSPGDLICADFSQYWFIMHRPKPTDSMLNFDLAIPSDEGHLGLVNLPTQAVEQRMSDEFRFDTDTVSFLWKMRADGRSLWPSTITTVNGGKTGWASVIAQR